MAGSRRRFGPVAAIALAVLALTTACGSGSSVDTDGFTSAQRKAAENVLAQLAQTSVYDAALGISLTEAHVPNRCAVHIEKTKPLTFRVLMTWVPSVAALGGAPGAGKERSYAWLEAVVGANGLKGDYSFHQGNERTPQALEAHYGDAFSKPVARCLVLQNRHFGLLPPPRG